MREQPTIQNQLLVRNRIIGLRSSASRKFELVSAMGFLESDKYKGREAIMKILAQMGVEIIKVYYICGMIRFRKLLVLSFFLFCTAAIGICQAPPTPPSGGATPCGGPFGTVCPIDGGISLLIAAGAALGGKKAFDLKKKKAS